MCDFLLELSGYVSAFPIAGLVFLVVGMVAVLCMPLINIVNEAAMARIKREHEGRRGLEPGSRTDWWNELADDR